MKIAMVFDGIGYGGIEKVGSDYAKILLAAGHCLDIYNLNPDLKEMAAQFPQQAAFYDYRFPRKLSPYFYEYGVKRYWWGKYCYPLIFPALTVYVKIRRLFYRRRKKEYDLVIAFSGHFNDLTFVSENFLKAKKRLCWLHGALYGYALLSSGFLNLYQKIKNLIVLNDDAQEEVFYCNKFLELNIFKLYNPTFINQAEIDEEKVQTLRQSYGNFLLMVARFAYPHKDHYTVIRAVQILKERYRRDIKLVLVGDGPERGRAEDFCKRLNLEENIIFAGSRPDAANYYKASYLLVHASVAGEGLPTVMLEAMAFERPMVVTDSKVGPREILGESEYGLLCKVQDPKDMASKIDLLYRDKKKYEHLQKMGTIRLKDFCPEKITEELQSIISRLQ